MMKIRKILALGHSLFKKYAPLVATNILHFCPILSPHIFGLKLFRLLKLGNFTDIFSLISEMALTF